MKNFFILLTFLVMFLLLKSVPKKQIIERIDIVKTHVVDFSGSMFLPKTIQAPANLVNGSFITISVASKKYTYIKCLNGFCLSISPREVPVSLGTKIDVTYPVKLFFAKDVK